MTSTPSIERRFGQASLDCDELRRSRLHPRLGLVLGVAKVEKPAGAG